MFYESIVLDQETIHKYLAPLSTIALFTIVKSQYEIIFQLSKDLTHERLIQRHPDRNGICNWPAGFYLRRIHHFIHAIRDSGHSQQHQPEP